MERELHYKDVLLLPKFSMVRSRECVDLRCTLGKSTFKLPVVPANMKTVIDESMAAWLALHGYFYIMHRFGIDTFKFASDMNAENLCVSISVGVNDDSRAIVTRLADAKVDPHYITIDIAHGHCFKMQSMINHIKNTLPDSFLIAGNVCTEEGAKDLETWGADAVKVGVGPGSVCHTKLKTGFSRPQFSAVLACSKAVNVPVIADGGVVENGDIAKALVAGAKMVMVGRLLAGFEESPGKKIIHEDGRITKEYFGSASEHNKGAKEYVEGCRIEIPFRGSIEDKLKEIEQNLRSSVSYAGGDKLDALKEVKWVVSG
jgi:GMP reductase